MTRQRFYDQLRKIAFTEIPAGDGERHLTLEEVEMIKSVLDYIVADARLDAMTHRVEESLTAPLRRETMPS